MTDRVGGLRIAAHITFYYVEERLKYLDAVIAGLRGIPHDVTIFVYSNEPIAEYDGASDVEVLVYGYAKRGTRWNRFDVWHRSRLYTKLKPGKVIHGLRLTKLVHPFFLTWENRANIRANLENFDVQMYLEDDMAFDAAAFDYWLRYKGVCLRNDYNLGFLRTEVGPDGSLFVTDLTTAPTRMLELEGTPFLVNDVNTYCGFWIYDRSELEKFVETPEWKFEFRGYDVREKSAIGWHGLGMGRYRATLVPLVEVGASSYRTDVGSGVRHLPNNYIGHDVFCKLRFPLTFEGGA